MKRSRGTGTLGYRKQYDNYHPSISDGSYYDCKTKKIKSRIVSLGTYKTKEEALAALDKYIAKREFFKKRNATFSELYHVWSEEKFQLMQESTRKGYALAYKSCGRIYNKKVRNLKLIDLQNVIDTCGKNYPSLTRIKLLMRQMMKYAIAYDLIEKDYSEYVNIRKYSSRKSNKQERGRFSKEQIEKIWDCQESIYDSIVLILIYTGVRINELMSLRKKDVYLDDGYFNIRKSKTEAGIRKVPIADKIKPFFEKWLKKTPDSCYFLFVDEKGRELETEYYRRYFYQPMMDKIGSTLTPHCCRHTCISLLTEAGVDPVYTKMIVGHKGAMTLTEAVYTHIDIAVLVREINKI